MAQSYNKINDQDTHLVTEMKSDCEGQTQLLQINELTTLLKYR